MHRTILTAAAVACATVPGAAAALELSLPVDCDVGKSCFIQNYVDIDASANAQDYSCGAATYNGHKGTDFRILSTRQAQRDVAVLAAAAGIVKGRRDGMPDQLIGGAVRAPKGKECGNGVVIDHGGGWETQYCHLRMGSVDVRRGQRVRRGDRLGAIGYSGQAAFAHLHFSVRKNDKHIDPFTRRLLGTTCASQPTAHLWRQDVKLPYRRGTLIETGFIDKPVTSRALEIGLDAQWRATATSPAFVFFARFINLKRGDRIRLSLHGPAGLQAANTGTPLERTKATYVAYVGKKLRQKRWPAGTYRGRVALLRGNQVVREKSVSYQLR